VPRIEPRVLNNDRHIGFKDRREIGIAWNRSGVFQIVEAQVQGTSRRDLDTIRDRLAVGEEHRDGELGVLIAGVENARRLVGD
jgi:hypothetical protein